MLRKIAVGTSAAVVAVGLAAAPALAAVLPRSAPTCGEAAQTEQCLTVASPVADISSARRNSSAPPPVGTPVPEGPSSPPPEGPGSPPPEVPSSPPSGNSGPEVPGPDGSGPPAPAPPVETAGPPAAPEFIPAPSPVETPAPTRAPDETRKPSETVLPTTEPRLPQTAVDSRPLTVAGGVSLVAAGLAWIGGARRRGKREGRRPAVA